MRRLLPAVTAAVALTTACNPAALLSLLGCRFRIEGTEDFSACGVQLDQLDSLSVAQLAQVASYWAAGEFPVDFTLNVGIRNPNTGTGDTLETTATMVSMGWDLYLDGSAGSGFDTTWVLSGQTGENISVPGTGETVVLPLDIGFDAFATMEGLMDLPSLIGLMLAIGGVASDQRDDDHLGRLLLHADPSFETPFGDITYPGGLWVGLDWVD